MHFDNVAYDRQTQSKPAMSTSRRAVGLPEAVKDVWEELRRNARAIVRYRDRRVLLGNGKIDEDGTPIAGEFHGIR